MPEIVNNQIKLTPEEITELRGLEESISFMDQELRKAERAGIDVTEHRKEFEQMKRQRIGLLREYS